MILKNSTSVYALWTDWNRGKGSRGKYGGIGWYRIINPMEKLENVHTQGEKIFGTEQRHEIAKEIGSHKVILTKYIDSFAAVNHLLTIRDIYDSKLLVDIDDNVFEVHEDNYAYKDLKKGSESYRVFEYMFREADGLICSTKPLAEYMKKYNKNVWVVPNAIDKNIWEVPMVKNESDKIKIGWVNGPTHEQDVPAILPALKEILKKYPQVEFTHIGWKSPQFDNLKGKQKMVFGTNGYKDFPKFLASLGMDILIAPLINDEFNRGKSNIKWMEGAMCEIPMVCSDVYPYSKSITHGKDGYLAKTTSDWIKYLSILIENKEKREKIGKDAKKTVLKKYSMEKFLPKYVEIFEEVAKPKPSEVSVVITRRKGESDEIAVKSLMKQTYKGIRFIRIEDSEQKGANWARNKGFSQVKTKYVLFSDNDINWKMDAVKSLVKTLENNPKASYAYGAYTWSYQGKRGIACKEHWSAERLRDFAKGNMVSTMTLVRTKDFQGFDESIKKFQDWDAWLTMLKAGKTGVHCGKIIFDTEFTAKGISANKSLDYQESLKILMEKHKTL